MDYTNHFKDGRDIEESKRYLADTFQLDYYSILINGNRSFSIKVDSSRANSLHYIMSNDERIKYLSISKSYDYVRMAMGDFNRGEKYTINGFVMPNKEIVDS